MLTKSVPDLANGSGSEYGLTDEGRTLMMALNGLSQ